MKHADISLGHEYLRWIVTESSVDRLLREAKEGKRNPMDAYYSGHSIYRTPDGQELKTTDVVFAGNDPRPGKVTEFLRNKKSVVPVKKPLTHYPTWLHWSLALARLRRAGAAGLEGGTVSSKLHDRLEQLVARSCTRRPTLLRWIVNELLRRLSALESRPRTPEYRFCRLAPSPRSGTNVPC